MNDVDRDLIRSFEDLSLELDSWTQRTHVAIAYVYLKENGFDGALKMLRERIKAFNAHHGIEESVTSGYNETTTVALLSLVETVMRTYEEVFPVSSAAEFCETHPQLMSKHVLRFFYSPERRMHPDAKTQFVEPDLGLYPASRIRANKRMQADRSLRGLRLEVVPTFVARLELAGQPGRRRAAGPEQLLIAAPAVCGKAAREEQFRGPRVERRMEPPGAVSVAAIFSYRARHERFLP